MGLAKAPVRHCGDTSCCGSRFLDNRVIMLKGSLFTSSTSSISAIPPTSLCGRQAGVTLLPRIKTATTRSQGDIFAHYPRLYNIYHHPLFLPPLRPPPRILLYRLAGPSVQDRGKSLAMIYSSLISYARVILSEISDAKS